MSAVAKVLPLVSRVGVPCGVSHFIGNDSWVSYRANGYWTNIDPIFPEFSIPHETELSTEETNGHLVITPDDPSTRSVDPIFYARTLDRVCLTPGSLFFRWLPWTIANGRAGLEFFNSPVEIYYYVADGVHGWTLDGAFGSRVEDFDSWDPIANRWVRIVGDGAGTIRIQTAPTGGVWTTHATRSYAYSELTDLRLSVQFDTFPPFGTPIAEAPGWIGPMNYEPEPYELPLRVSVGDVFVTTQARTLPLRVSIGDSP